MKPCVPKLINSTLLHHINIIYIHYVFLYSIKYMRYALSYRLS